MMEPTTLDHRDRWYLTWRNDAGRNYAKAAQLLAVPESTLKSAGESQRWRERALRDDTAHREHVTADTWARLAAELPTFATTVVAAASIRTDANRKPPPDSPTLTALKAALAGLAMFGITPVRTANLTISTPTTAASLTDDDLDTLTLDQLIAVSLGRPITRELPADTPPPQDFPSTQPGGREVTDPLPPVERNVWEDHPDYADAEADSPAIEAFFRAAADTADEG
jgi:hypothetical protein